MARRPRPPSSVSPRPEELALLQGIVDNPGDDGRFLILADWLDEHDDPRRAELLRLHRRLLESCCQPDEHPGRAGWQSRIVELLAAGVRPCVPRRTVALGKGAEMVFAWVPPGSFLMGSPPEEPQRGDDETLHRVTLTRGFWMGATPITQAQWQALLGDNPSRFKGDDCPVEHVSWDDCQDFCKRLGERVGQRCRLPTEGEWEYACRAGTTTPFHFGETISTDRANYDGRSAYGPGKKGSFRQKTTAAGCFPANAWGLYDLHGNVWEWCQDWYGPYSSRKMKDPQGSHSGPARVLRGGSWYDGPWICRSAFRYWFAPAVRLYGIGCRVLLCLD